MIPFAVWHEGLSEDAGRWVLDVQGDRLLLADEGRLYWQDIDTCKVIKAWNPEMPTFVMPHPAGVQQAQNGIVLAQPNRAMRRHPDN